VKGKIIHVTLEKYLHTGWGMELFELPPADVPIDAEPDGFVAQLVEAVEAGLKGKSKWDGKARNEGPTDFVKIADRDADDVIQPADIVSALDEARGSRDITLNRVSSGGAGPAYHFRHPLDYLGHDGGGGLASGPGTSVGAALALVGSGRLPVSVLGDGDFMQGNTALWTAARYRIPLLMIISNNTSNFNDEMHQETMAKDRGRPVENRWIGMRISEPEVDLCGIARAQGVTAIGPIERLGELLPAIEKGLKAVEAGETYFIDVRADTGYAQAPLMRGSR
jgi:thiamine pyrophosphate-dependent acetolactate synthase large subunit-like protein